MKEQIEKQAIEEMACDMCTVILNCNEPCKPIPSCHAYQHAKRAYAKGYRKQSDGEWIAHEDDWCGTYYTCSACGCDWTTIDGTTQENNMRFCPECGAHMKGGAE